MAHEDKTPSDDKIHPVSKKFLWLADPRVVGGFIWLPILGLGITIMAGFIFPFDPKHKAPWDFAYGSWAIFGFAAYCTVVLAADPLFKLLSRDEDYYGEEPQDD
ncbi:MAG: hypothetical protein ACSHXY_01065 [Alphaproteobacteria bacterium]